MSETKKPVFIIGEAGVNHNGSITRAIEMIHVAKESGVDAIKFQTAIPELVIISNASKANYQIKNTNNNETQIKMLKKIHLPLDDYKTLKAECDNKQIEFMSTAFDNVSIDALKKLGMKRLKIPSGEITNLPYLRHIGQIGKPIILSTGIATMEEVRNALVILIDSGTSKEKI